jgi:solute carrier family 25 protein 14/30
VGGLYKGWVVTSSRAAVLTSAQLGSYDTIKNNLLIGHFGLPEGFLLHLTSSMLAGIITTTAANPIDVIKTRYMADKIGAFTSPIHCITSTYSEGGVAAFFKGWMPAYWRLGPHTVISLILIEKIRLALGLKGL